MLEILLSNVNPIKETINRLEKKHPIFCLISFQLVVALFLITIVGGIALTGGCVIWLFYHFMGMI